jgi:hypothetical protein
MSQHGCMRFWKKAGGDVGAHPIYVMLSEFGDGQS